jgi:hypothetical protein
MIRLVRYVTAYICSALLVFLACGCSTESPKKAPDYSDRGSKALLLRPYQETVAELTARLGKKGDSLDGERASARRTLEELIWLHYQEPDFFVFLSLCGNNEAVEEGIDNMRRFPDNVKVREALCRLTGSESDRIRDEALYYLSQVNDEEFRQKALISHIEKGLKDRSEVVRRRAVAAMREIEKGEAARMLEYTSDDPAPSVRGESLRVSAFIGEDKASTRALKGLGDSSPYVRVCALEACGELRLKDREATEKIKACLDDRSSSFYAVPYDDGTICSFNTGQIIVQDAAHKALERIYRRRFDSVDACRRWCGRL